MKGTLIISVIALALTGCLHTSKKARIHPKGTALKAAAPAPTPDDPGEAAQRAYEDLPIYAALIKAVPPSSLDETPMVKEVCLPLYPDELRSKGVEGVAVVQFIVNEKGRVSKSRVITATDPLFGKAAAAAMLNWQFKPLTQHGRPVSAVLQEQFPFRLH